MKYLILAALTLTFAPSAAQWSRTGSNVYLTTGTDNIGIGTNTPASKLHIMGNNSVFKISSTSGSQYLNIYHDGASGAHLMSTSSSGSFTLFNYGENHVFKTWLNNQWEEKFRITATGNLGIGTDNPQARVHVKGNNAVLKFSSASGTQYFDIYHDGATGAHLMSTSSSGSFTLFNYGENHVFKTWQNNQWEEKFRITATGNLGIGTSSPQSKLQVFAGSGAGIGGMSIYGTNGMSSRLYLSGDANNVYGATLTYNSSTGNFELAPRSGYSTVLTNGNFGIGTSSPAEMLTLANGGKVRLQDSGNAYSNYLYGIMASSNYRSGQVMESDGSMNFGIKGPNASGFAFRWLSSNGTAMDYLGDDNEIMRLTKHGNVGIGTIAPDERLTVRGTIHTHEVRVDTEPEVVPDYVFEKDYDLLSLTEIETYIKENKHLPEVPSAKEMEENGMNLKEMNLLLLKKVEELTLHLIEQEKKISELLEVTKYQTEKIESLLK